MDTKHLRSEIERITRSNGRRHFSKDLRTQVKSAVVSLRERGASYAAIADALSISTTTVGRYLKGPRVEACPARPVSVKTETTSCSKVTTPSGFEVEGLDAADIATLIQALS